ncbi:MAG: 50S ribosomal protein L29 [Gammaproteobacteria bacterium]|nr:50S ribosomal protein L29 [Gammaproteobacteria bacterium]
MKASEMRSKSVDELKAELVELRKAQFANRVSAAMGEAPRPHIIGQLRKDVARIKTVLREMSAGDSQ